MKIVLENLTKVFPSRTKGGNDVVAVNDMCIEIPDGELVGLLGPSGCGKSTTLFMLSGLEAPTGGKIYFGDQDVTDLSPEKRGIGLVFQNYALYPHMTVEQNIMFPLLNMRMPKEEAKARALEAAGLVQIQELMQRKPKELSGGQQQRVAIARTLAMNPEIILFDEPMSALDVDTRLSLRSELKRIQKMYGNTMIYITHDQEEAFAMSDKIMVMNEGVIHQLDTPENIVKNPSDDFVKTFVLDNLQLKLDSLIKYVKEK